MKINFGNDIASCTNRNATKTFTTLNDDTFNYYIHICEIYMTTIFSVKVKPFYLNEINFVFNLV